METIEIKKQSKRIFAQEANLSGSRFHNAMLNDWDLNDVAMCNLKIVNANLSDLEIEGAQMGGAYIHNVGGPPEGHPAYDPNFKQRPVKFEDCNLNNSTMSDCYLGSFTITNCNLTNAKIEDCNLAGMTINGILVSDLLAAYRNAVK
ncbi:pentapeptide repeat-containing protein [Mucilaginibacter ginkgonis]|uniref:Pentapeptide repeat-containing protein n=1 Tax=Mucilaginibacter ginkgonis TaxID=2682091 RepID=A0A6I4HXB8_9SPHI|nr:pentapeptide repeat-containing protein [Mucilaginibacter ginkgonis]QQL51405.1 pentapeptide repeat-containing protein [Mucilaginibacter ginkgonis]